MTRWCHALNTELPATRHPAALFILSYDNGFWNPENPVQPKAKANLSPPGCAFRIIEFDWFGVALVMGRDLTIAQARWTPQFAVAAATHVGSLPQAFRFDLGVDYGAIAASTALRSFAHIWILEQDVAWQGNLFDALGVTESWDVDLVTANVPYNATRPVTLAAPTNVGLPGPSVTQWGTSLYSSTYKQARAARELARSHSNTAQPLSSPPLASQAMRYSQRLIRDLALELHGFTDEAYANDGLNAEARGRHGTPLLASRSDVSRSAAPAQVWPVTLCTGQLTRSSRAGGGGGPCTVRPLNGSSWGYLIASCNTPCAYDEHNWVYNAGAVPAQARVTLL